MNHKSIADQMLDLLAPEAREELLTLDERCAAERETRVAAAVEAAMARLPERDPSYEAYLRAHGLLR